MAAKKEKEKEGAEEIVAAANKALLEAKKAATKAEAASVAAAEAAANAKAKAAKEAAKGSATKEAKAKTAKAKVASSAATKAEAAAVAAANAEAKAAKAAAKGSTTTEGKLETAKAKVAAKNVSAKAAIANEKAEKAREAAAKAVSIALKMYKDEIEGNNHKPSGVKIINPSDKKDWQKIKYYSRINNKVKINFRKYLHLPKIIKLKKPGPCPPLYGNNVLGNKWHKLLSDKIKQKKPTKVPEGKKEAADWMIEKLRGAPFGIELFESNFTLNGYMYDEDDVFQWRGDADAIGWYYNKNRKKYEYVIVDWKVLNLLNFWKSKEAFGKYLHQCLVYARLLKLHLNLKYLPSILIVPISSNDGQDIHPGLFWNYPVGCKKEIERFSWSIEQPVKPSTKEIVWREGLINETLKNDDFDIQEDMLLTDFFDAEAKVKDLLEMFGVNKMKIMKQRE